MKASEIKNPTTGHVLLLPYPSQGHINPMLQFGKRIASHNRLATAAITRFIASTTTPDGAGQVIIEAISDGFDEAGFASAASISAYLASLESFGSRSLHELLEKLAQKGQPVSLLVYDSFLPWAVGVARRHGAKAAAFFTQSVAVDLIYWHAWEGRLKRPGEELPGLPKMEADELPSLLAEPQGPYAAYLEMVVNQYKDLDEAGGVMLINSFYELEPQEMNWLTSIRPAITIGPTIPSTYLDNRIPNDNRYAIDLFPPETSACKSWACSLPFASSAIFISFGSMAVLSEAQMVELAFGLASTNRPFLWVVRASEAAKLPPDFADTAKKKGNLLVGWAPQLEILATGKFGCFVTHCGWNSTMEGLALGVPMVGLPQWIDQPTDAKYIEQVWGVGLRARKGREGIVGREEVERCVREVMEGEGSEGIRRRVGEWKEASRQAVDVGGSSDRNIVELLDKFC